MRGVDDERSITCALEPTEPLEANADYYVRVRLRMSPRRTFSIWPVGPRRRIGPRRTSRSSAERTRHGLRSSTPVAVRRRTRRRRALDNPRVLIASRRCCLIALLAGLVLARRDRTSEIPLHGLERRAALRAARRRPRAARRAGLRARAQPVQALGRAAAGGAVRAVPRQARRRAARDDDRAGGARAAQRQRDHPRASRRAGSASRSTRCSATAQYDRAAATTSDRQDATQLRAAGWRGRCRRPPSPRGDVAALDRADQGASSSRCAAGMIELYRAVQVPGAPRDVEFLLGASESPTLPPDHVRAPADRLALQARSQSGHDEQTQDDLDSGGVLVRTAAPILNADGTVVGAVVVSESSRRGRAASRPRQATSAYEQYQQLRSPQGADPGRVPRDLPDGHAADSRSARRGSACTSPSASRGRCRCWPRARARLAPASSTSASSPRRATSWASLVEAFNMMAAELRTSQEKLEQSRARRSSSKNVEVDARRRYIETILERVATGVISLDATGRISTVNGAAERLLGLDAAVVGQPVARRARARGSAAAAAAGRRHAPAATPAASCRRSRSRATTARSIWPPPRRC